MWTWKGTPLFLAAVTYLCVGTTAYYNERYQTFLSQHHDNPKTKIENAEYCAVLMNYRSVFQSCKPFNIFIHASEVQLQDVCGAGGYPYHGTGKRQSRTYYPITICRLGVMTRSRQCVYYAAFSTRRLVLSCDENRLPVQLDEVLTMSG
ncbi:PREDICTED: angiogenin-like [Gekko japonicus]|uniref:Angiogenin-like n=1 Tax=Gekko japonicus TaxID=146911 RepID=A0ABM1KH24_GEKJA|nr:PREDICTED: angiogenin-like [Gekko japonicus]